MGALAGLCILGGIAGGLLASVLGLIFDGKKTAAVAGLVLSLATGIYVFVL